MAILEKCQAEREFTLAVREMPFELFPDDADELDAIPHPFTDRNRSALMYLCRGRRKAAMRPGILEPPLLG